MVSDDNIDSWDVLEHMGALVDKSLLVADGELVPRYRLLETTRLYALERLARPRRRLHCCFGTHGTTPSLRKRRSALSPTEGAAPTRLRCWMLSATTFCMLLPGANAMVAMSQPLLGCKWRECSITSGHPAD